MPNPLTRLLDDAMAAMGVGTPPAPVPVTSQAQIDTAPVERIKARALASDVQDAVLACLRDNSHLFAFDPVARNRAIADLAWNLWSSGWSPDPLTLEDMDAIGWSLFDQMVWAVTEGRSIFPLEAKVYERLRDASDADVPPLRGDREHRPAVRGPTRSRRRLR